MSSARPAWRYVPAGTVLEPSRVEVQKDGHTVGRIIEAGGKYRFYKESDRGARVIEHPAATNASLGLLKKWIEANV